MEETQNDNRINSLATKKRDSGLSMHKHSNNPNKTNENFHTISESAPKDRRRATTSDFLDHHSVSPS